MKTSKSFKLLLCLLIPILILVNCDKTDDPPRDADGTETMGSFIIKTSLKEETKLPSAKDRWVLIPTQSRLKFNRSAQRHTQIALRFFCVRRIAQSEQQIKLKSSPKGEGFSPRMIH